MSDEELLAEIDLHASTALGYYQGEIASQQATSLKNYLRQPIGNEEEGRSQVVSSDVFDTVEGLLPILLRPFISSDQVVQFNPLGKDDVEKAEQETDYINWVVTAKNSAFLELYQLAKSGLLNKTGVGKWWWDTSKRVKIERYEGMDEAMLTMLLQDTNIKIVGKPKIREVDSTEIDPTTGQLATVKLYDVTLRQHSERGFAKYSTLPPEEFLIGADATSIMPSSSRYCEHRTLKTVEEIRDMGYEIEDTDGDTDSGDLRTSPQFLARHAGDEPQAATLTDRRLKQFRECYVQIDYEDSGYFQLRKVCRVGSKILANEEIEELPFCAWSPCMMPFKFYGLSTDDIVGDIHLIKTTLKRQLLDNIYSINNNRDFVSKKVSIDDLLNNVVGGFIRVDDNTAAGHVIPATVNTIGPAVYPMFDMLDADKENRTGYTRYNAGSDATSLNNTATGITKLMNAANMRVELMQRNFAECAVKPLMLGLHGLCRRHSTQAETVQLRGQWVELNPRDWVEREDMTVTVGIGNGDEQQQQNSLLALLKIQMEVSQAGLANAATMYKTLVDYAKAMGKKDAQAYFVNPAQAPPQQPQPNPEELKVQAQQQTDQKSFALDAAEAHDKHQTEQQRLALEHAKFVHQSRVEVAVAHDKHMTEQQRLQLDEADLKFRIAQAALASKEQGNALTAEKPKEDDSVKKILAAMQETNKTIGSMVEQISKPKNIVRDKDGRVAGIA